jgi:hypothetical protein
MFYSKTKEYNVSAPHDTFSKMDNKIRHKTSLNTYKKIKIIPCILSHRQWLNKNKTKQKESWKLNNFLLDNKLKKEEIKSKIKDF